MSLRGADRANRYIDLLNNARLAGNWTDVTEYARKVAKHTPNEQALLALARAELACSHSTPARLDGGSKAKLEEAIHSLQDVKTGDKERQSLDLGATRAILLVYSERWPEVLSNLSRNEVEAAIRQSASQSEQRSALSALAVCKAVFALGTAQLRTGDAEAATTTFQDALPFIRQRSALLSKYPELARWASKVLTQASMKAGSSGDSSSLAAMNKELVKYRGWAAYSKDSEEAKSVWTDYHILLSTVLRSNIAYSDTTQEPLVLVAGQSRRELSAARAKQFEELQSVERSLEQHLARTTVFPNAAGSNTEWEVFVDRALTNWHIITSAQWTEADLGQSGKATYSRNVLEMLYRASSKTFHSTPILRHLFSVHAYLGECDLAIKAFNSYTDIIGKGKARAEKSGSDDAGLDGDDAVLFTAAQAMKLLCLYGERKEAEKAYEIGQLTASWLEQRRPRSSSTVSTKPQDDSAEPQRTSGLQSTRIATAVAYRAIGQSQSNWARFCYETTPRRDLQQDAINSLRRSQTLSASSGVDLETEYLLASALAENRQVKAAFEVTKKALAASNIICAPQVIHNAAEQAFEDVRQKLPLWHLLVLLLSAMSEHDAALSTCETISRLLVSAARKCDTGDGHSTDNGPLKLPMKLKDGLGDAEKDAYLQIMMTEIELLMLMDGGAFVPTKNNILMSTYEFLFGSPAPAEQRTVATANGNGTTPKSRTGTAKSFRASMFSRPKSTRKSLDPMTFEKPPPLPTSDSNATLPPSVTVTDTDGAVDEKTQQAPQIAMSIRSKPAATETLNEKAALDGHTPTQAPQLHIMHPNGAPTATHLSETSAATTSPAKAQPAPAILPVELHTTPAALLARHPPAPIFPPAYRKRHSLSLLTSLWLFFAKTLLPTSSADASSALSEAQRWLSALQTATATISPAGTSWLLRGWGLGATVAQLQADLLSLEAQLAPSPHAALAAYEDALLWAPDHAVALTGLSEILLDMAAGTIPLDAVQTPAKPDEETTRLARTACRDRAYMLTSAATKTALWDDAKAWFLLGRAWEVVGHADKAAECYWWVVELEDGCPVRRWDVVGGYTA